MSLNPILKVLLTIRSCEVKALLMGGQACILYGAAEFSRDTDFAVLASPENLARLKAALQELQAEPIFFPPLEASYLERGHACHFRCRAPDALGLRIDVMTVLRGCEPFSRLWERREMADLEAVGEVSLLSLPDLVQAKKTQRDKDWPMIQRLVEAHHARRNARPSAEDVSFWLREARTVSLLREVAAKHPEVAAAESVHRSLLRHLQTATEEELLEALHKEREHERLLDKAYWEPLRRELEMWRQGRRA